MHTGISGSSSLPSRHMSGSSGQNPLPRFPRYSLSVPHVLLQPELEKLSLVQNRRVRVTVRTNGEPRAGCHQRVALNGSGWQYLKKVFIADLQAQTRFRTLSRNGLVQPAAARRADMAQSGTQWQHLRRSSSPISKPRLALGPYRETGWHSRRRRRHGRSARVSLERLSGKVWVVGANRWVRPSSSHTTQWVGHECAPSAHAVAIYTVLCFPNFVNANFTIRRKNGSKSLTALGKKIPRNFQIVAFARSTRSRWCPSPAARGDPAWPIWSRVRLRVPGGSRGLPQNLV